MKILTTAILLLLTLSAVGCQSSEPEAEPAVAPEGGQAEEINWNLRAPWGATRRDGTRDLKDPVKIFDNLYSVGLQTVSAYLVTTSDGLVLIDTTYAETADAVLNNIRAVGQDPANLKYILITHSHNDHVGGASRIKQATGARVGMGSKDWEVIERQNARQNEGQDNAAPPLQRDLVLNDGESLTVGDATFKFYSAPGHSPGATAIEFQAHDGGMSHRTLSPGGLGISFGPEENQTFLASTQRLKELGPWDAMLSNHPWLMPKDLAEIESAVASRGQGQHPAVVGPVAISDWFDAVIKVVNEKIALEQHASQ